MSRPSRTDLADDWMALDGTMQAVTRARISPYFVAANRP